MTQPVHPPALRTAWTRLLLAVGVASGIAVAVLLLGASSAQAGRAAPGAFPVEQPDGSQFLARQWGDEWYHGVETTSGHTVLERADGYWVYAAERADGTLARSDRVVGRDAPSARRHLRDATAVERALDRRDVGRTGPGPEDVEGAAHARMALQDEPLQDRRSRAGAAPQAPEPAPAVGTAPTLVILAQFSDRTSLGTTPAQWNARFFGAGRSVRDYFEKASYGQFSIAPAAETSGAAGDGVVGWLTLDMANPGWIGDKSGNELLTRKAIIAADPFVDFAAYDTNGDGVVRNTELHISVVAAGYDAVYGSSDPQHNVWAHQSYLLQDDIPRVDGRWVGGWGYTQLGEMHARLADTNHQTHQATVGIIAHELSHDLGLPDLYDYDYDSEAVGNWSIMAAGEWTMTSADTWFGQTPVMLDAWSRATLGWISPVRVTGASSRTLNAANGTSPTNVAVQLGQNPYGFDWSDFDPGGGEYFLAENRQRTPGTYDEALPGDGLLLLHIDESQRSNRTTGARLVDVVEADGLAQLDGLGNEGDPGDVFPGTGNVRAVGAGTVPGTAWNDGTASGVAITEISDSGPSMTASFVGPANTVPRNDAFAGAVVVKAGSWGVRSDNTLATVQAGETTQGSCSLGRTLWYRFTAPRDLWLEAHTYGSRIDTVLNMWRGSTLGSLTPVGCNDEDGQGSGYSYLAPRLVQAGETYWFQVGGYYDGASVAGGEVTFSVDTWPVNDAFTQAEVLVGGAGTISGNDQHSTQQAGEPRHLGMSFTGSVWYQWTAPSNGQVSFDTLGGGGDTVLAVYTGSTVGALQPVAANNDVQPGTNARSRVQFAAAAGVTYRIAVGHVHAGAEVGGPFVLRWRQPTLAAPAEVRGTPGTGSVTVSWSPPPVVDGVEVVGYRVTASDGLHGCSTTGSTSCRVDGLVSGQYYTFTVAAITTYGESAPSAASPAVTPIHGDRLLVPSKAPSVDGDARLGTPLLADPGTWPGATSFSYTWNRDGIPIAGASGATYTPVRADIGRLLTVRVDAAAPGTAGGSATSAATLVRRAVPVVDETKANAGRRLAGVRAGRTIRLVFSIRPWADGGDVRVLLDGKRRGAGRVSDGTVVVRVATRGVAAGKRKLVIRYGGTIDAEPVSRAFRLRVRRVR